MHNKSYVSSPVWRRLAAFLYDCLLLLAIFFIVTGIAIVLHDGEAIRHWSYTLLLYLIGFFFFAWFWRHGGQTLGMRAWRVRIVTEHGAKPEWSQCARRYLSGTLLMPVTLIWALFDGEKKALHDRLSHTFIAVESKA